jgi:type II secretory pathway predicted ATPase ExeA
MLEYGVRSGKGFTLLTGEVGTGKTTLLQALLTKLDSQTKCALIFNPRLETRDFFRILFEELGLEHRERTKADYLLELNGFLIDRLKENQKTLLIVDEAQNLSAELLEEIRLLSNLETARSKLIQIMLVGQPELKGVLARPDLRQLRQRISLRHHLRPFSEAEIEEYVAGRLGKAGYTGRRLFKRSAIKELYAVTGGTPRLVNSVCDSVLLLGYSRDKSTIDGAMIREVAADLELGDAQEWGSESSGASPKRRRRLLRFFQ